MSRICFEQNALIGPAQHSIEDPNFTEVVCVAAKFADDLDEEADFHALLHPLELWVWADEDKVVSVHIASQVARSMSEAARASFAAFEAHQC